jgi:hypothetical protein
MDIRFDDGDGITFDLSPNAPTEAEMQEANHILACGSEVELKQLRASIIRQMCKDLTIDWRGRKGLLIERLLQYVCFQRKYYDLVYLFTQSC